jgi:Transposase IS116/IS110/IS902 family
MSDRSGLSRGDRNRNARLARLRQLLPAENAIVGIDLADDKQAAVVTDHDSRVIARRRVSARAWELGGLLDWRDTRARLADVEARMAAVLDDLGLTGLVATIAGLTPVGAAAILAETGDPARFASPRALVKHAGLCPRDNVSGAFQGKTSISAGTGASASLAAIRLRIAGSGSAATTRLALRRCGRFAPVPAPTSSTWPTRSASRPARRSLSTARSRRPVIRS